MKCFGESGAAFKPQYTHEGHRTTLDVGPSLPLCLRQGLLFITAAYARLAGNELPGIPVSTSFLTGALRSPMDTVASAFTWVLRI